MATRDDQTTLVEAHTPLDYDGQLGNGYDVPTILETDDGEERCPYCGDWYKQITTHWTCSSCQYPPVSAYKMELLKGMMLGDGHMNLSYGNFRCGMTNKTFLEWLTTELGWLASDVRKQCTAVEIATKAREGLGSDTFAEDCVDLYSIRSRPQPQLQWFTEWYSTGEIVFPTNIELTPTSLAMWYVSDGGLIWHDCDNAKIKFTSCNESERPQAIIDMLEGCGFTVTHGDTAKDFYIPHRDVDDFFSYIGAPVEGFKYKWEYEDRERYDELKTQMREQHCTQTLS